MATTDPAPIRILEGTDAWAAVLRNPQSRWVAGRNTRQWTHTAASRLERAFVVPQVEPRFPIDREDRIFTIGSCFARNIENHLIALGMRVDSQVHLPSVGHLPPHSSVVFNRFTTHSMLNELRWALDPACEFAPDSLVRQDEGWVDLQVVGEVAPAPRETVLATRDGVTETFRRIRDCRVVIITLGLVEAWYDTHAGIYLNRAPGYYLVKAAPERFQLHVLDYRANREALEEIHSLLRRFGHPEVRMIVTVSPVPMSETFTGEDVLVANCYSKSTLRAVAGDFARAHDDVDYFPSYESVTLSAPRVAFEDDRAHVTLHVVAVNVQSFLRSYVTGLEPSDAASTTPEDLAETRLAAVRGKVLEENDRLRATLSALEARLAELGLDDLLPREAPPDATRAEGPAGVVGLPRSSDLRGNVEVQTHDDDSVFVSGWALDLSNHAVPVTVVAIAGGECVGSAEASISRPDVARAFQLPEALAGFTMRVPRGDASSRIQLYIRSGERVAELSAAR